MSGLVTLLSERLQTIAVLRDAESSAKAYATKSASRLRRTVYNISRHVCGISKTDDLDLFIAFVLAFAHLGCTFLTKKKIISFGSLPFLAIISLPSHFSTLSSITIPHYRSCAHSGNRWWGSGWRLCAAHLCHHAGLPLLQAHRKRWAQRSVYGQKRMKKPLFSF